MVRPTHRCTLAAGWKLLAHLQNQTSYVTGLPTIKSERKLASSDAQKSVMASRVGNKRTGFSLPVATNETFASSPQSGLACLCLTQECHVFDKRQGVILLDTKVSAGVAGFLNESSFNINILQASTVVGALAISVHP